MITSGSEPEKILIVDDEYYVSKTIDRWLSAEGYECVTANSVDQALEKLEENPFALLISDIMMPVKNGIELLQIVREKYPDLAALMATAVDNRDTAITALNLGAYGYMIKPFDRNEFIINVANALDRRRSSLISREYEKNLQQEVHERTQKIRKREEEIAFRLVWASEYRDDDTGEHIKRIGLFSAALAEALGWSQQEIDDIRVSAPMHDVGKIGISDTILLKPGKLTDEEFEKIKTHTTIGGSILGGSGISLLDLAQTIALYHHERWDGTGYPSKLKGEDIPAVARIVSITDVYDALVYDRVYRPAFSEEKAVSIMQEGAGTQFDPTIFECFLDIRDKFRDIRENIESLW